MYRIEKASRTFICFEGLYSYRILAYGCCWPYGWEDEDVLGRVILA